MNLDKFTLPQLQDFAEVEMKDVRVDGKLSKTLVKLRKKYNLTEEESIQVRHHARQYLGSPKDWL